MHLLEILPDIILEQDIGRCRTFWRVGILGLNDALPLLGSVEGFVLCNGGLAFPFGGSRVRS